MKVDILFFDGCPNHQPAVELVQSVVLELGMDAEVREVQVRRPEDAERLRFLGSPTVRVNDVDIEPARREDPHYAMCCRMYGKSGVPARDLVASALREAVA